MGDPRNVSVPFTTDRENLPPRSTKSSEKISDRTFFLMSRLRANRKRLIAIQKNFEKTGANCNRRVKKRLSSFSRNIFQNGLTNQIQSRDAGDDQQNNDRAQSRIWECLGNRSRDRAEENG